MGGGKGFTLQIKNLCLSDSYKRSGFSLQIKKRGNTPLLLVVCYSTFLNDSRKSFSHLFLLSTFAISFSQRFLLVSMLLLMIFFTEKFLKRLVPEMPLGQLDDFQHRISLFLLG